MGHLMLTSFIVICVLSYFGYFPSWRKIQFVAQWCTIDQVHLFSCRCGFSCVSAEGHFGGGTI